MGLVQALPAGLPLSPIVCAGACKPLAAARPAQRSIPQLLSVMCSPCDHSARSGASDRGLHLPKSPD